MALNSDKPLKLYYSIKEVAEMLNVSESMLRFWEKEIPAIKPKTTGHNIRQYTCKDIENIKVVYHLVKVRGFKLSAARKMLRENREGVESNSRVLESLINVRTELQELRRQLDYLT
ncbi:MAG: MerR family transcriptional regulator [Prevotellaceae bacterium]|nr:MerR family transcriptional regulator [Prevotella sp.]MDD7257208.1 MerR family transcriptional regulator [Prevotellaceae bacterium]MDY6129938.1 MerR family transcriptional regulator [Prevotella sp.]